MRSIWSTLVFYAVSHALPLPSAGDESMTCIERLRYEDGSPGPCITWAGPAISVNIISTVNDVSKVDSDNVINEVHADHAENVVNAVNGGKAINVPPVGQPLRPSNLSTSAARPARQAKSCENGPESRKCWTGDFDIIQISTMTGLTLELPDITHSTSRTVPRHQMVHLE